MATKIGICNMAIAHLGIGQTISNIESEQSAEARACRAFYDTSLESILRDYTWPFATRFQTLSLIEEDPTDEWRYSYRYPNACLYVRRILSGVRNDNSDSRSRYIVTSDDSGILIYSDVESAQIEYTSKLSNAGFFPPDFALALSYRLAAYIAPSIGRDAEMSANMLNLYLLHANRAIGNAKNEEQRDRQTESELILARE